MEPLFFVHLSFVLNIGFFSIAGGWCFRQFLRHRRWVDLLSAVAFFVTSLSWGAAWAYVKWHGVTDSTEPPAQVDTVLGETP